MGAARDRTTTRHTVDRHILGRGVPMSTNAELFDQAKKVIPGGVDSPVRAYGSVGGVPRFIDHAPAAFPTVKRGGFGGVDRCGPIHCGASVFGRGHIPHDDGGLWIVLIRPEYAGWGGKARVDALFGQALAIGFF